ncbi:MAG: hypothetical protein PWR19_773 [Carnobacterium sp.]|nr:hypothetical protein [Carnobacterium sp.]
MVGRREDRLYYMVYFQGYHNAFKNQKIRDKVDVTLSLGEIIYYEIYFLFTDLLEF